MTSTANSLVAVRVDSTTLYSGLGIVESVDMLVAGVRSGSWVDTTLGTVGTVAEGAVWVLDPFGALVASGFGWVVEHVEPLSDALDWLAGDPDQVATNAQTWRNVAVEQETVAQLYSDAVNRQIGDWSGPAGSAYRGQAGDTAELLTAMGKASEGMSAIVAATGSVVALVRMLVRDLIGELISILLVRLPLWTAETVGTLGFAAPYVVAQIAALVAKWGAKISRLLKALVTSLRNLMPVVRRLDEIIETIATLLRRRRPTVRTTLEGSRRSVSNTPGRLFSSAGALTNRQVMDAGVGLPRTMATVEEYARLAGVEFKGANVTIVDHADDIAYLDMKGALAATYGPDEIVLGPAAFQDAETLVRALGHESVHVQQYIDDLVATDTFNAMEEAAYAAEQSFVDTWRRNAQ